MLYYKNIESSKLALFSVPQNPEYWTPATQEEIDAYLLAAAKVEKQEQLVTAFSVYECGGFEYEGNVFCLKQDGISNIVDVKTNVDPGSPTRYTFANVSGVFIDFEDVTGWNAFKQAICTERDRIMMYYINKRTEIQSASTIEEVEAIVIDFSPA